MDGRWTSLALVFGLFACGGSSGGTEFQGETGTGGAAAGGTSAAGAPSTGGAPPQGGSGGAPPVDPPPVDPPPVDPPPVDPPPVDPPPVPPPLIPLRCNGDASQTAMIGDSYLALSGEVTNFLQSYSGQTYRTHYVSGTQMVGGLPPNIPDQARIALGEGPVQTFIMDGGGNDVLIGDLTCRLTGPAPGSVCEGTILNVLNAAGGLLNEAAAAGVQEVIFFFYPHIPPGLIALNHVALNDTLDYAAPLARDLCEGSTALDCTFIDLRPAFAGHPEYIGFDGIHPTTAGSEVIAQLLWQAMQDNCATGLQIGP